MCDAFESAITKPENPARITSSPATSRPRVIKACTRCRKRKSKCNGQEPCAACAITGASCIFAKETPRRGRGKRQRLAEIELFGRLEKLEKAVNLQESSTSSSMPLSNAEDTGSSTSDCPGSSSSNEQNHSSSEQFSPTSGLIWSHRSEAFELYGPSSPFVLLFDRVHDIKRTMGPDRYAQFVLAMQEYKSSSGLYSSKTQLRPSSFGSLSTAHRERLVEKYFQTCNRLYPIVTSPSDFHGMEQACHDGSPRSLLHYASYLFVLVLGRLFDEHESDIQSVEARTDTMHLLTQARAISRQNEEHHSIELVRAQTLETLVFYLTEPTSNAWTILGKALRSAQTIGLHRRQSKIMNVKFPTVAHLTPIYLFWTLYILDIKISLFCGRSPVLQDQDHDQDLQQRRVDDMSGINSLPPSDEWHSFFFSMIASARCGHHIYKTIYACNMRSRSLAQMLATTRKLDLLVVDVLKDLSNCFGSAIDHENSDMASNEPKHDFNFRQFAIAYFHVFINNLQISFNIPIAHFLERRIAVTGQEDVSCDLARTLLDPAQSAVQYGQRLWQTSPILHDRLLPLLMPSFTTIAAHISRNPGDPNSPRMTHLMETSINMLNNERQYPIGRHAALSEYIVDCVQIGKLAMAEFRVSQ